MPNKRVLVLVDICNLYHCLKSRGGAKLDYKKLLEVCSESGDIFRAIAYGAEKNGQAEKFKNFLISLGYEIKFKGPSIFEKADWDVDLVIDAVQILDSVDTIIFVTGDGDMTACLNYVKSRGKRCEVIGYRISHKLVAVAHKSTEIPESLLFKESVAV